MANKVYLEISNCKQCPHRDVERFYTADSWEHCMEWICRRTGDRIALVDTFDKDPDIPSWCPLKNKGGDNPNG